MPNEANGAALRDNIELINREDHGTTIYMDSAR